MYRTINLFVVVVVLALLGRLAAGAPPEEEYSSAAALYSSHQWEQAAAAFGLFVEAHPDHQRAIPARFFQGESLAQVAKYDAAAVLHAEFLKLAPQHALARVASFRIGECLLLAGKKDEAKQRLEEFRRIYPIDDLNTFALPYLGDIALAAGEIDAAQALYEQALRDYPSGPMAETSQFGVARCQQAAGKLTDAIANYEHVANGAEHPLADDARLQIGLIHYEAKRFDAALSSFSAFRTTFADSDLAPQAWYWLGLSYQAAGRIEEAATTLANAAKQFAETSQGAALHAAAGDALRLAADNAQADLHYQRLIAFWPQSEWADDAMLARAELAIEAGDMERAAAIGAELSRRYPDSPHAHFATVIRARGLIESGKFAEAETLLRPLATAGELSPESSPAKTSATDSSPTSAQQAGYLLALAQIGQKKYEAALTSLDRIGALPTDQALAAPLSAARCAALMGLERFGEAVELLQTRLEAESDDDSLAAIRSQLVVALARSGKLDQAAKQIQLLPPDAVLNAQVASAVLLAAEEVYKANDLRAAERLFAILAREKVPAEERSQALSGLAWTQYRLSGKLASAATFERLLRDYPDSPLAAEAALVRAKSLEDLKQYDAALATYRLVIDMYADSPLVPNALWGAGRLHDQLDQKQEAAELLKRLVDEHPKFAQRDAALYQLGWVQADLKDLAAADASHARLIEEYPESEYWADAAYRLAEQAARRKDSAKAIELADKVLETKSAAALRENTLYLRGQLAAAASNWDDAAKFMSLHASEFPQSPLNLSARYWQAEAAFRKGDYESAGKQLTELEIDSQARRESWLGIVPLRRAQCLAQQKRWPEALRIAESVAKRHPQFSQRYEVDYLIGRALGSQARFAEARAAYTRVLESPAGKSTETAAMAQWMIGETYFHQKRYTDAVAAYDRCAALSAYPRWQAAALLQSGKCRLITGDATGARSDLERVASEFYSQPVAAEAKTRLASLELHGAPAATVAEKPR
jgi:TolA-binding protein